MRIGKNAVFAATLAVTALLSACTSNGGSVSTDGSTSMSKVIGALGEAFESDRGIKVTYSPTGSGSGIQAVSNGRCDIGLSSRELRPEEIENGLSSTVLAYDGISIIVNPDNTTADLSTEQLADIYTGAITDWSELGGAEGEIVVIGREANSGTRDGFETITGTTDRCTYRQELSSNGDVVATVANNPNAIGYASMSAVKDSVKTLTIDGVAPNEETVRDGSYAVQRPFVLVTKNDAVLSAEAQSFFDYAISENAREVIASAGVVPAN